MKRDRIFKLVIILAVLVVIVLMVMATKMAFTTKAAQPWQLGDPLPFVSANDKTFDCDDAAYFDYYVLYWLCDEVKIVSAYFNPPTQHLWVIAVSDNGTEYAYDYGYYRTEPEYYQGHEISLSTLLEYMRQDMP